MSVPDLPELLAGTVDGEDVVASVDLGGEDRLVVTPTRTLVYRADGLLSDESVAEYPHDVERLDVSEGRRKAKLTLEYGLDGSETISVAASRLDDVLHPILAGVLAASGVTGPGESVLETFRFSELTLIVTDGRLVKHVGSAVWDEEYEEFHYDDVTDLHFEEGTVATAIVLTHGGRQERFKAPNESEREIREALTNAVCDHHGVGSLAELRLEMEDAADDGDDAGAVGGSGDSGSDPTDFGDGPTPLSASPAATEAAAAEEGSPATGEPASGTDATVPADSSTATVPADSSQATSPDAASPAATPPAATPSDDAGTGSEAAGTDAAEADTGGGNATGVDATGGTTDTDPLAGSHEREAESGAANADSGDAFGDSGFEPAGIESDALADEVAALREVVTAQSAQIEWQSDQIERQSDQIERQSELVEQLVEELRRGR